MPRRIYPQSLAMVFPVTLHGSKSWILRKQDKKDIDSFEFGARDDSWEYYVDRQENKQLEHRTNKSKVLTQSTNDQTQIIIFWIQSAKTHLHWKTHSVRKRIGWWAARWMDLITVVMGALLEDLKVQAGNHLGEDLSMWLVRVHTTLVRQKSVDAM